MQLYHKYIYPDDDPKQPGHIIPDRHDFTFCKLSIEQVKKMSPRGTIRVRKTFIPDRNICTECEKEFRQWLVNKSKIIDAWA